MKRLLLVVLLLISPLPNLAADSTFRCQGGIVSLGDTTWVVSDKCGEPDRMDSWQEDGGGYHYQLYDYEHERYILPKLIPAPIRMKRWAYDLGANRFIRILTFQNDELIRIETGEKGAHQPSG